MVPFCYSYNNVFFVIYKIYKSRNLVKEITAVHEYASNKKSPKGFF